jgi:LPXTG-site transpeptidase (sortase) family protein
VLAVGPAGAGLWESSGGGATAVPTAVPTAVAGPTSEPATTVSVPVRVRAPAVDLDAAVVAVGVTDDGQMAVPDRVAEVGWYRFGTVPGAAAGSAVLAGHVDDRVQGEGAFADLAGMRPGDGVSVDGPGSTATYRVREARTFAKDTLPVTDLFRESGPPRLVLVTCDGPFDRAARSYRDNLVVLADPVPGPEPPNNR